MFEKLSSAAIVDSAKVFICAGESSRNEPIQAAITVVTSAG